MRFSWRKTAWLLAMLVPAVVFGPASLGPLPIALAVALTAITVVFGHTVGLHRGIIHRSFSFGPVTRRVFAVLFALTGLGGPRAWIRQHALRDHHQSTESGPRWLTFDHGPLADAWWTLCCDPAGVRWSEVPLREEDDRDPFFHAVDRWFYPLQLAQAVGIWLVAGWEGVVIAWCARNAVVLVGHWAVGYLAHTTGSRPYRIDGVAEEGRNLGLLGILSVGEGFHNNHHAAPSCARIGREWWQVDAGWSAIVVLEKLGLVWDVHRPTSATDWLRPGARLAAGTAERGTLSTPA